MRAVRSAWLRSGLLTLALILSCKGIDMERVGVKIGSPNDAIPPGFKTYTLFLATSSYHPDEASRQNLALLAARFKEFGDSIGDDNLAVWVGDAKSAKLSVSNGKFYLDRYVRWVGTDLSYSDGPYIILSQVHPDRWDAAKAHGANTGSIAISFKGSSPDQLVQLLEFLEARIRRDQVNASDIRMELLGQHLRVWLADWWRDSGQEWAKEIVVTVVKEAISR